VATPTTHTRIPTVSARQLLDAPGARVIDLRSPAEFAEDHVPGAHNAPLFDDVERALVGTLYRRESPASAFAEARRIAAGRIGGLVAEIGRLAGWAVAADDLAERVRARTEGGVDALESELVGVPREAWPDGAVVLHCWRGGLRSRSVVAFLRELGLDRAVGLEGGYKAYRREVLAELARVELPRCVVLRGLTGVGKTLVLRELERQRPGWTVDLEALAGHRSSILGMVGLAPRTQKAFDSALAARLREVRGPCVVFEGESRKVGDVIQPARVWTALQAGANVRLVAPVERRVRVLLEDYLAAERNRAELRRQLPFIEARLGPVQWRGELVRRLDQHREEELVRILLERYYDPLYAHSEEGKRYALEVDASDPARAASAVAAWVEAGP